MVRQIPSIPPNDQHAELWQRCQQLPDTFLKLEDTPGTYEGASGFTVVVAPGEDGLVFGVGGGASLLISVINVTVPADSLPFTVIDPRVSASSYVALEPINRAAEIMDARAVPEAGQFVIFEPRVTSRSSFVTVLQESGSMGSLLGGADIPFDTTKLNINWAVDLPGNRIVSLIENQVCQASFTVSGTYNSGTQYDFGLRHYDSDDNLLGEFFVGVSTSNQNDVIAVTGIIYFEPFVGSYVRVYGIADTVGLFDPYELTFNIGTQSGLTPAAAGEELQFRALVVTTGP